MEFYNLINVYDMNDEKRKGRKKAPPTPVRNKNIYIRDLTDKDREMLLKLKAITGKNECSQIVMAICYRFLDLQQENDELKRANCEIKEHAKNFLSGLKGLESMLDVPVSMVNQNNRLMELLDSANKVGNC